MGTRLDFRILGPLTVAAAGHTVPVGGSRQRTILGRLLLTPNRIVSVDSLINAVWEDAPPATARTQVAICVAALRKTFKAEGCDDDIVTTAHPGYLLDLDGHDSDLATFHTQVALAQQTVARHQYQEAADIYARSLALWRGRVLHGVVGLTIEQEVEQLEELRRGVYDEYVDLSLRLGRHQELLPQLMATVRDHPLRERTRYSLMMAQYRAGRRTEAMDTYREGRRHTVEELGLEPCAELKGLHDRILLEDPTLGSHGPAAAAAEPDRTVPAPEPVPTPTPTPAAAPGSVPTSTPLQVVPSELPPNVSGFTGRAGAHQALDALLSERSEHQALALGLITGVAGVGKTALAVNWSHKATEYFLDGRLFADLGGHDQERAPTPPADILSRFLRVLGVPSDRIPPDLEERTLLYRSVLANRQLLIVLDNAAAFSQIEPLLPGNGRCCVLVTSRTLRDELIIRFGAVRIQLGPLTEAESQELLHRTVGAERIAAEPEQALLLCELCDRLPLALRIATARLASRPHWKVRHLVARLADEQRRLDELSLGESQVRAGFALSYRCLSPDAARLFRRLALLAAPDFAAWTAAAVLDVSTIVAERLVEQLVDSHLMEVASVEATGQQRYKFQNLLHLYARECAVAEEAPEEQLQARFRWFRSLLHVAETAHRREYGGDFSIIHSSEPRRPLEPAVLDELVEQPLEWLESERLSLIAAVEQCAGLGLDELAWDLTACLLVLCETRNYVEAWQSCCETALAVTRAAGNRRGQALMLAELGALQLRWMRPNEAAEYLLPALELFTEAEEEHGRGLTLRWLGIGDRLRGDLDTAATRMEEARSLLQKVGDASSEAHCLNNLAQIDLDRGCPQLAVNHALASVEIAERIGETRGAAQALLRLGHAYMAQGQLDLAEQTCRRVVQIVEEKGDGLGTLHALLGLGEVQFKAGLLDAAELTLRQAGELSRQIDEPLVRGRIELMTSKLHRRLGRPDASRRHLDAAVVFFDKAGSDIWLTRAVQEANCTT